MQKRILYFILSAFFVNTLSHAQINTHISTCNYYPQSENYCIKLNMHSVINPNHPQTVNSSTMNSALNLLNEAFENTGITFHWDGNIIAHNNSDIIDYNITNPLCYRDDHGIDVFNSYIENIGLNLFFFNRNIGADAIAEGVAESSIVVVSDTSTKTPDVIRLALAHNVGHALGLFHLQHGTTNGGGSLNNCENEVGMTHVRECLNSNRCNGGDFVDDTPPINQEYPLIGANCNVIIDPSSPDACGQYGQQQFAADNFMLRVPSTTNCVSGVDKFTPGQIVRIKRFLDNELGYLLDACPQSPKCDNCNEARYYARELMFGPQANPPFPYTPYVQLTNNSITINGMPPFMDKPLYAKELCSYNFYVKLPNHEFVEIHDSSVWQTTNYFDPGSSVTIKVVTPEGNECCFEFDYQTQDPLNSNAAWANIELDECPVECQDCSTIASEIMNSLESTLVNPIGEPEHYFAKIYSVTIPNFDDCITGTIDWGDGTVENIINDVVMYHQYALFNDPSFDSDNHEISIIINENGNLCSSESLNIDSFAALCNNPCLDFDLILDYTNVDLVYSFNVIYDDPCFVPGSSSGILWSLSGPNLSENINNGSSNLNYDFSGLNNGVYYLQTTISSSGCRYRHKTKIIINEPGGIHNDDFTESLAHLILKPNPTKSEQELRFEGVNHKEVLSIEVYNMIGNLKQTIKPERNSIKVVNLTSGIYFVTFNTKQGVIQKKVIIE